jgi:NADH-quinone oxidoreductase subunit G
MAKEVSLTIDGIWVNVPAGTLIVDAAKKAGIDIPVFCYHPKMEPVGMCRMCLVDVGRPAVDRSTNQPILNADGSPKILFGPKLETGCTTPVQEGMVVHSSSAKVSEARKDVVEFILTSHPLDCPVCDKGGECPLQNLTMGFGPGESRFQFGDKMHMQKHVPLGELIYLDRERCIQCARCVRFQSDIAGDPVIGFNNRGRSLEIVTHSEPGFDSIFSGNTTDICPVGALTTADFRFGARAWELTPAASVCPHCPVGCNMTVDVRREVKAGGKLVIKRIMPRQNEAVNEIWLCDKGRFGHHYAESADRLTQPLMRKNGELVAVSWEEAFDKAGEALRAAGSRLAVVASGRLTNEDLYALGKLAQELGGKTFLLENMAGGDLVRQVGLPAGSNLGELGKGSVILVAASDLYEEAPLWYLRIRAAVKRGARLVVVGARPTKLEGCADRVVRCSYGEETQALKAFIEGSDRIFYDAGQVVVFYGREGLDLQGSQALATACANLLVAGGKAGQVNSGLVAVWPEGNTQGAWDLGFHPPASAAELGQAGLLWVAGADPAGDPALAQAVEAAQFVVVQELFLSETAHKADLVFPAQSNFEREGTYTSGERRVQRFYPVVYPPGEAKADYAITAQAAARAGVQIEHRAASLVFLRMAEEFSDYAGLNYQILGKVSEQWPPVGRNDLYFGGTGYENKQGLGTLLGSLAGREGWITAGEVIPGGLLKPAANELLLVPVTRLYDQGRLAKTAGLLDHRRARAAVSLHPQTAAGLGLVAGEVADFILDGQTATLPVVIDTDVPAGVGLIPRSCGVSLQAPVIARPLKSTVVKG